jgi:hypothetical protein
MCVDIWNVMLAPIVGVKWIYSVTAKKPTVLTHSSTKTLEFIHNLYKIFNTEYECKNNSNLSVYEHNFFVENFPVGENP